MRATVTVPGERAPYGLLICVAATACVYVLTFRAGFIWNDADYVTKPALRSLEGLFRIWFQVGSTEQYYPLLHSFFWLQHKLWGDSALGYHAVNVVLHGSCAWLLYRIVHGLAGARTAWLAAALFVVHPVYVESVAWISEQKNTLSTFFYLAAGLWYLRFDGERSVLGSATRTASGERKPYMIATFLFVLALLSKSVTASLPAALLVVFWWKRGRLTRQDWIPLLPWFVAGAAVGLFTAWVEHRYIGAHGADFDLGPPDRVLLAGRVVWFYLGKLAWPADFVFIYPRWEVDASDAGQWLYPLAALALLGGLWALRRRSRAPLAAFLFFAGSLFPTMGFFNVYAFKFSFVADHWQYLPSIGIVVLAAGGAVALWERRPWRPSLRKLGLAVAGSALLLLAFLSFRLTPGYRDMETFYREIIAKNPSAYLAQYNLAEHYVVGGRFAEAEPPLRAALGLKPDSADAWNNLGGVLLKLQRPAEAVAAYESAVRLAPADAEFRFNLGSALATSGRFPEAVAQFREAVRLRPDYPVAQQFLERALEITRRAAP